MKNNIVNRGLLLVITVSMCAISFMPRAAPLPNKIPWADASAGEPYKGYINQEIIFDGTNSYDPDGDIINYTWDFGDSTVGYGVKAPHSYDSPGTYTVTLTVMDDTGATHTNSTTVVIALPNLPPTAPTIDGPQEGKTNTSLTYTVVATDPDNQSISYIFDWGDEETHETAYVPSGDNVTVSHTWKKPGDYTITVAVSDGDVLSQIAEFSILIEQGTKPTGEVDWTWLIILVIVIIILLIIIYWMMKQKKPEEKKEPKEQKRSEKQKEPLKETKKIDKTPVKKKKNE